MNRPQPGSVREELKSLHPQPIRQYPKKDLRAPLWQGKDSGRYHVWQQYGNRSPHGSSLQRDYKISDRNSFRNRRHVSPYIRVYKCSDP